MVHRYLYWFFLGIWGYIEKLENPVKDLEERLQKSQDNVDSVKKLVLSWVSRPLFERKDGKRDQLLIVDEHTNNKKMKQYKEIGELSEKVVEIVSMNRELLMDPESPETSWDSYLKYIDGIVLDGLIKTVAVS